MYGIGASLRAAVDGGRDGRKYLLDQEQAARDQQRQQELQGRDDIEWQQGQEDRSQRQQDYQEFQRPEMQAQAEDNRRKRDTVRKVQRLGQAYARGSLDEIAAVYNEDVHDGYTVKFQPNPDGSIEVIHPKFRSRAANVDELVFGKADGTGMGLYQMIDPDGIAGAVEKRNDRAMSRQEREWEFKQRDKYAQREHGRAMTRARVRSPQYGIDAQGNQVMIEGDRAKFVMGPDGKPLRGAMIGRGGRVAGGAGGNPFGNSAEMQRLWRGVQMARAADPTGKLVDLPDDAVANMVTEIERYGKARSERMKIAAALVRQSASGMGETMSPQEIQERASALVGAVDSLAGPEPRMQYGVGVNAMGEPIPSVDEADNDPLGIR